MYDLGTYYSLVKIYWNTLLMMYLVTAYEQLFLHGSNKNRYFIFDFEELSENWLNNQITMTFSAMMENASSIVPL